jgi:hypothetical protein
MENTNICHVTHHPSEQHGKRDRKHTHYYYFVQTQKPNPQLPYRLRFLQPIPAFSNIMMMTTHRRVLFLGMAALLMVSQCECFSTSPRVSVVGSNRQIRAYQSSEVRDEEKETEPAIPITQTWIDTMRDSFKYQKPPPLQVEDNSVLLYDVFLLVNLSASISFWVTHRMDFRYISSAISEGSLVSILWILAGLCHGAFLYSAVDGHYGSTNEKGGPSAAGLLGLHTFMSMMSLRLIVALATAVVEHRKVFAAVGEDLIPLELISGLVLMSCWRALHSSYTPRV